MFRTLVTVGLFSAAIVSLAPSASAQVEPTTVTDESRSAPPDAPAPAPPAPPAEDLPPRQDPTMFGLGVAFTSVGGVAFASGAGLLFVHALSAAECIPAFDQRPCASDVTGTVGAVLIAAGVALLVAGVPMIVVGGKRTRRETAFDPVLIRF